MSDTDRMTTAELARHYAGPDMSSMSSTELMAFIGDQNVERYSGAVALGWSLREALRRGFSYSEITKESGVPRGTAHRLAGLPFPRGAT